MALEPARCRRTVHYSGHVQGVGFRYTTERLARRYEVGGFVRNLSDGRVEVVVEGTPAEVGAFLADLDETMVEYIRGRQLAESPGTGEFRGFGIRP
ncbi:MAG: acylphosphatase [Phycisphaerae bacterium]|nr:acylphosphatase [Phycisphaerae bacterium]